MVDFGGITIYNLIVERRDNIKAKKLRSKGIVPASIYGRNLEESILIQIPQTNVNSFLGKVSKGSRLTVEVDGKKYNTIFKNITREPIKQQIEQIEFQHIVADEAVNSVALVGLINRDKNQNMIQQHVEEIPYNALPKDFIQDIVIDLDGIKAGSIIKVEDLDIAKNGNIRITIPEDTIVLTVAERKRAAIEEKTDEEQEA
ncbi:50S ribosomal protein L25 [Oscillospiraceae bacterium MB24-C1]|nr:50S ribosomal protein L25 [Oscillospiraceae bacterium MB24-C1]